MEAPGSARLTTAQLAERAGMSAGTLRMWESRYGFPTPRRLPGGHHRYSERDAEMLREVLRLRAQGMSISAAIASVKSRGADRPASIFAGLRESRPDLRPIVVDKRALLRITHAIEDEYCARASAGTLIASFQRAHFYRRSERRWHELARTADVACALADFDELRMPEADPPVPIEVPVDRDNPLAREWALVVDAPDARACLAAWEQAANTDLPDLEREFELIWSFEPEVVRTARTVACGLLVELAPELAARLPAAPDEPVPASQPELRFANSLAQRMIGYLAMRA